jgi:putative NADH-flavin reductase
LLAFVNSPPARNGLTNATKGLGATNFKPGYEGQFARYLADILRHFRDAERIDFTYVSPVNEPQ